MKTSAKRAQIYCEKKNTYRNNKRDQNKRRDGKEVFEKIREIRKQREGVCLNEIQRGIM